MSLSSSLPPSIRPGATPGRIAGLFLVGLAILCCILELSSGAAGHHGTSSPPMVQVATGGETDTIAFTDSAGGHDHTGAECPGESRLILGSAPLSHAMAVDEPAPGSALLTEAGEGLAPQPSGTARSPASVPHLLCVMRT
jgi:hypothetical protein